MRRRLCLCLVLLAFFSPVPALSSAWFVPPVDGPIRSRFDAPESRWGPGHRGIDYPVAAGTLVRAVAGGRVAFAGDVGGTRAVTIAHAGGIESTYSDLAEVLVAEGQIVEQGFWVGRTGRAHAAVEGLHLGIKVDGAYVDPELLIGPLDTAGGIRLAPLVWEPPGILPALFSRPLFSANALPTCVPAAAAEPGPPNDNIAVLVAGIGSKTEGGVSAALYESGANRLGYDPSDTYRFSYRGTDGPGLHEPYARTDTFGDLRRAASRLGTMLKLVARQHPDRGVDLIAHSQGGIVARTFLQLTAEAWAPDLPQVEHLVTFASPHEGAPLASGTPVLDSKPLGRAALRAASWWAASGGPIPDPYAPAVAQLAPGSELMERLDREAVLFGTKVLSLAIPNDVVVPADHARWRAYDSAVVGPKGLNGHDAIVTAADATAIAKRFLRDGPPTCRGPWDVWGPRIGRAVSFVESVAPRLLGK